MRDLDLTLLRTFVSVVDAGGFTRGAERVHRTQSTVSQQIRKLEEQVGRPLLVRTPHALDVTEDGERLLGHARHLLRLADATLAAFDDPVTEMVRVGLPEDYAIGRLPDLLATFSQQCPHVRLEVRCDLSIALKQSLDAGDLDLVLIKETSAAGSPMAQWEDPMSWAVSDDRPPVQDLENPLAPLPLVLFPQGCVYRNGAVHVLEQSRRRWRVAYTSPSLVGVQAAVRAGLGVSPLSYTAWADGLRPITAQEAQQWELPPLPSALRSLYVQRRLGPGAQALADLLIESLRDLPLPGPYASLSLCANLTTTPKRSALQ